MTPVDRGIGHTGTPFDRDGSTTAAAQSLAPLQSIC